jgi:hypothetical protein
VAKFVKGNKGRPTGAKEHSWARVSHWIDKLNETWPKLTDNQRAHYSVELTKMLVSKLKSLPTNPEESKVNADEAMLLLKDMELRDVKTEAKTAASPIAIPDLDDRV